MVAFRAEHYQAGAALHNPLTQSCKQFRKLITLSLALVAFIPAIPNLLVPEIAEAIAQRCGVGKPHVPCIYVCNIAQPGETQGYTVSEHIKSD